jgi:hypothetical protein
LILIDFPHFPQECADRRNETLLLNGKFFQATNGEQTHFLGEVGAREGERFAQLERPLDYKSGDCNPCGTVEQAIEKVWASLKTGHNRTRGNGGARWDR